MKTLQITAVKVIFGENVKQPIVVFETAQGIDIARTPKQALLDLQNSGRALNLSPNMFNRGLSSVSLQDLGAFKKEIFSCQGATITGDINPFKAGDKFTYTAGHPALEDKLHPLYGKVKLGEQGTAEKDGVWVNLFLNIPQTMMERQIEANASATATLFASMFGLVPQSTTQVIDVNNGFDDDDVEESVTTEALGTTAKAGK